MSDFDSPWKEALTYFFDPFIELFFGEMHAAIDWRRGHESLDKELQQIVPEAELGRRVVDHLVKVWLKSGEEKWILIHVEVQTSEEIEFARRMYVYHYRLRDRYNQPVVSMAILADDRPTWRPSRYEESYFGCSTVFAFPIVKLVDFANDPNVSETSDNPFATVVRAYLKARETRDSDADRLEWKTRITLALLEHGWDAERVNRLFRVVDWLISLPEPLKLEYWREVREHSEKTMPFITTPQQIGREEGREEGRVEGRVEGLHRAIALGLKLRHGVESLELMRSVQPICDLYRLERIIQLLDEGSDLQAIRDLVAGP